MSSSPDDGRTIETGTSLPAEFTAQAVTAWLDDLPIPNTELSSNAVLGALRALSASGRAESGERFGVLERLRPTAYLLSEQGTVRYLQDATFPLADSLEYHAQRGIDLVRELGKAYSGLAMSDDFFVDVSSSDDSCALVIHRALEAYGVTLLRLMESYAIPPEGFWRNVYGLYHQAESHRLHQHRITDASGLADNSPTILDRFAHILLCTVSGSHRHRPREIRQIYTLLGAFANKAELHTEAVLRMQDALFHLDLDSDCPPGHVNAVKSADGGNRRFLFTRVLVESLLRHFEDPANRRLNDSVLGRPLIKRLLKALGAPEVRRSGRIPEHGECRLIIGLDGLIEFMQRETKPEKAPATSESPLPYSRISWLDIPDFDLEQLEAPVSGNHVAQDRIRSELFVREELLQGRTVVSRDEIWNTRQVDSPFKGAGVIDPTGQLINSSARGYCLLWLRKEVSTAKVGELVGLAVDDASLHIGVIRWLRHDPEIDLKLGIELLSPAAEVVKLEHGDDRRSSRKALFLSANILLQQPARLLVSPAFCRSGQTVVAEGEAGVKAYRLDQLIEETPSFQHFALIESDGPSMSPFLAGLSG